MKKRVYGKRGGEREKRELETLAAIKKAASSLRSSCQCRPTQRSISIAVGVTERTVRNYIQKHNLEI